MIGILVRVFGEWQLLGRDNTGKYDIEDSLYIGIIVIWFWVKSEDFNGIVLSNNKKLKSRDLITELQNTKVYI